MYTHVIPLQFAALQLTINKIKGCYQLPEPQLLIVLVQIAISPTWHSFSKPAWKSRGAEYTKVAHVTELELKTLGGRTGSAIPYSPTQGTEIL